MKRVNAPKSQLEISSGESNTINRSTQIRRDNDKIKDFTNGLYDIDYAIQYYIKNVIKPTVVENGKIIPVPVMYGSPEQWTSIRKMAYIRDNKGKMVVPLIAYTQTGGSKNMEMPVDKLDANNPHLFYTYGQRWSKKNQYDNFNALTGKSPSYELFKIIVPDYINLTYEIILWTTYMEQMNKLIEAIVYSEGAYWGEEERSKFRTTITDYSKTVEVSQGADRFCQTTLNLTVYGYIIPDTINKQLSMKSMTQKIFTNSKILFNAEVDKTFDTFTLGRSTQPTTTIAGGGSITPVEGLNDTLKYYADFLRLNFSHITTNNNNNLSIFSNVTIATPPAGISAIVKTDFIYLINGQTISPDYVISITQNGTNVEVVFDTTGLGYTLNTEDIVAAIGKFTS